MAMTHCSLSLHLGTAGVEGLRDGKLHAGKLDCVRYRVSVGTCTCRLCVGVCTCKCT